MKCQLVACMEYRKCSGMGGVSNRTCECMVCMSTGNVVVWVEFQ